MYYKWIAFLSCHYDNIVDKSDPMYEESLKLVEVEFNNGCSTLGTKFNDYLDFATCLPFDSFDNSELHIYLRNKLPPRINPAYVASFR